MSDAGEKLTSILSDVDDVALPAGRMIGRFEVVSVLGQGSFGITYQARDLQLGRDVAIKEYLPVTLAIRGDGTTVRPRSTATAEDFRWGRERFIEEGRIIAGLADAPGVVRMFDFVEANGTAYIVMELVQGESLDTRLRQAGALDAAVTGRILEPLLSGLEQVHAAGFLHRDVKPANILLDDKGSPRLIDFGASRAAVADRTATMTAIFTPGYAAVEQFASTRQGPWTDIYGLAATIYHAISGKPPPNAIDRMIEDTCEPLARLAPAGYARELLAGIDAGLAVRADDRPQSIAAWRAVLSGAEAGAATMVLPRPPQVAKTTRNVAPAGRRRLWLAGAVAASLLLASGGYLAFEAGRSSPPAAGLDAASERQRVEQDEERAREATRQSEQQRRQAEMAEAREALAAAQAARQQAEAETARQQGEAARLKTEDEAVVRRQAAAEAAAVAARQEAEADAKAKAETEAAVAAAKQKAEADAAVAAENRKAAEAVENGLRLTLLDRRRLQVALTSLGFDTRGDDGALGGRSREMIAAWQERNGVPATGFVSAAQRDRLMQSAAAAITRWDDEQKQKLEEEKKKAEEKVAADALAANRSAAASPPPAAVGVGGLANGTYGGGLAINLGVASIITRVTVRVASNQATGRVEYDRCGSTPINLAIDPAGAVTGSLQVLNRFDCSVVGDARVTGRVDGRALVLEVRAGSAPATGRMTLTRTGD